MCSKANKATYTLYVNLVFIDEKYTFYLYLSLSTQIAVLNSQISILLKLTFKQISIALHPNANQA